MKEPSSNSQKPPQNLQTHSKKPAKKTFWPYGILLSLFAIVLACVATIVFASDYPVYEDEYFFEKYQAVKDDYSAIEEAQKKFNQNFSLSLNLPAKQDEKKRVFYTLDTKQKELIFTLKALNENESAKDLNTSLLLTRPHTSVQNETLELSFIKDENTSNTYFLKTTLPPLEKGRWQLKLKLIQNADSIGFFSFNVSVL